MLKPVTKMLRTDTLPHLLEDALSEGFARIGQVAIQVRGTGYSLRHVEDLDTSGLQVFESPDDASLIARFKDEGKYRPLKSAPDLRHGWRLNLSSLGDLILALDALYPAALGNWRSHLRGDLVPVPLRSTVNRQTGMYRITGKITDGQGTDLVKSLCQPGCLRCILWPVPEQEAPPSVPLPENQIPLLCGEACSLFVAACRKVVKGIPLDQVE